MILPAFGASYVPSRVRLILALAISFAVTPTITGIPDISTNPAILAYQVFAEIVIGLMIGTIVKIISAAIHTAGMIMAMQSGLGQAMMFDPNQSSQGAFFGNFKEVMAIALMFSLNLHHYMIMGVVSSYEVFPPVPDLPLAAFAETASRTVAKSFAIGTQIAAPLIIVGLLINLASGLLARLMPAFQVFFVIMPAQIMLSIFVFMATLSAGMIWYMGQLQSSLEDFLSF